MFLTEILVFVLLFGAQTGYFGSRSEAQNIIFYVSFNFELSCYFIFWSLWLFWGSYVLFFGPGFLSKTILGSTCEAKKVLFSVHLSIIGFVSTQNCLRVYSYTLFSMVPSILTFDFDYILLFGP